MKKKKVRLSPFATSGVRDVFIFAIILVIILMSFSAFALVVSSGSR